MSLFAVEVSDGVQESTPDQLQNLQLQLNEDSVRNTFLECMHLTARQLDHMSKDKHSDLHFATQYPFLYARKYKLYFKVHIIQGLVWAYGRFGLHIFFLLAASVAIVGGFRSAQQCGDMHGSTGVFSFLQWPPICNNYLLMTTGSCEFEN